MNAEYQRDHALSILSAKLKYLSKLFKESFLSSGRGAVMVYANDIINRDGPKEYNYRTKEDILEFFDNPSSHQSLKKMIEEYDQKKEGIMVLITDYSNATYFITVKLN
jgi:hypothetical protein